MAEVHIPQDTENTDEVVKIVGKMLHWADSHAAQANNEVGNVDTLVECMG